MRSSAQLVAMLMDRDLRTSLGARARLRYGPATFRGVVCLECGAGVAVARLGPHSISLIRSGRRDEASIDLEPVWSRPWVSHWARGR
jgi:hypothetical protein